MGFSSALQGRAAHDALIIRQDAELRLMDTMKRCIQMKSKCDREYSISLAAVSQQGLKVDRADELQGSQITKSWRTFMDELDQQSKQFKLNAELLEVVCEKISHLSQDKRKARKSYQEEHSKIAARLNHLTDEVTRKKSDYQKHLEGYKALRTRFEEHYIKSGRSGRKLDDVRDKYQKACRKLHLTHNEYVLSITEAIEVEKDFRTVLLPGLLEHQESVQESFILLWKKILQEACQHSDLTSDKFHDIQKRIETVINNINPNEEYREFTEKHKTSPATPLVFQFDESLIEDIPGKLQASTLTVDNLTVDWLRSRLNDLEISVKDIQEKQEKLIGDSTNGSPHLNGINNGSSGKDNQKHSKDLNSLKCQEKQKQKLADMIKCTLNEVGCEELPSGCDDHLAVEQNFIENTIINDQQTTLPSSNTSTHSVSTIFQRGADVMSNIRVPLFFKRRSTPVQPRSPQIKPRNRKKLSDSQIRSQSLGSLSVNNLDALDHKIIIKKSAIDLSDETNNKENDNKINISLQPVDSFNRHRPIIVGEIPKKSLCAISVPNLNINTTNILDTKLTNLTNNNNNINNVYAELELNEENINLESINEEQNIYGNHEQSSILTITAEMIEPKIIKTSIDHHLDKIDEINRILDDNLRRTLPRSSPTTNPKITKNNDTYVTIIDSQCTTNNNNTENIVIDNERKRNSAQLVKDEIIIDNNNIIQNPSLIVNTNLIDESKNLLGPLTATKEVQVNVKKRSISFSHKLLTNFNNFKSVINSKQQPIKSIEDTEINDILNEVSVLNIPPIKSKMTYIDAGSSNSSGSTNRTDNNIDFELKLKNIKPSKLKILDKKPKKSKNIRNTFRTKLLNFQIRRGKICENCSKRRKIYPNKSSVFDFAKDFNNSSDGVEIFDNNDLCVCPKNTTTTITSININNTKFNTNHEICCETSTSSNEDMLSINDHTYCMPFIGDISYTTNRPLYEEEWFHGVLPREEVVRLLKIDGDFLVRETIRNEESQIVLSVCCRTGHKHFIVQTTIEGHFRFEGPKFPSIQELIIHQYQSELPVTVKSGVILRKPVLRERWELSNDDVVLIEKIGRGNFGDVYKAKLKSTKLDVAVKTCRMTLPDEQKRKFLQEGRILKQYDHPNIVKLIGICVQKQPIMIVMELVPGGSLLNFLRKNSNTLTSRQLMGMCRDAAAGMRYLESKNCIHRDLAARNCLIDSENSVKISDFGMSREEEEYIVSDGMKQIPVKWTAPEALHFGKYTTLCDVWSYGILMWEIFSKGDTPYSGLSNSRAREKIDTGFRMPAAENTPPEIYRLMLKCWAAEAESRPHFDEIFTVVDALISRHDNS